MLHSYFISALSSLPLLTLCDHQSVLTFQLNLRLSSDMQSAAKWVLSICSYLASSVVLVSHPQWSTELKLGAYCLSPVSFFGLKKNMSSFSWLASNFSWHDISLLMLIRSSSPFTAKCCWFFAPTLYELCRSIFALHSEQYGRVFIWEDWQVICVRSADCGFAFTWADNESSKRPSLSITSYSCSNASFVLTSPTVSSHCWTSSASDAIFFLQWKYTFGFHVL